MVERIIIHSKFLLNLFYSTRKDSKKKKQKNCSKGNGAVIRVNAFTRSGIDLSQADVTGSITMKNTLI